MFEVLHQNYHVQGFTTDGEYVYWSFTDSLVKTNLNNTVIAQIPVFGGHLGDIDYYEGKLYASLLGQPRPGDAWDAWTEFYINVYDAETLALEDTICLVPCYEMHENPEQHRGFRGVDGVALRAGADGKPELWVACASHPEERYDEQVLLRFSMDGKLLDTKCFKTGNTTFGIQNLEYEEDTGYFWFSTYGSRFNPENKPMNLFCVDIDKEEIIGAYYPMTPYGFHAYGGGKYLVSFQSGKNGNRQGFAYDVTLDEIKRNAVYKHHSIP